MKIADKFTPGTPVISFEFFPPKTDQGVESLYRTVEELRALRPSFVSVTYGAGGSTRERTVDLGVRSKRDLGLESMAHLTCVGSSRAEIAGTLDRLQAGGIENVLALRGDPPKGEDSFQRPTDGFGYASELVGFIRQQGYAFCLGGACYPEGHVESRTLDTDLANLLHKVNAGVEFLVTQLFFRNNDYFAFVRRARTAGIGLPIVPGIMPITNLEQIKRFTTMCGAQIPAPLLRKLEGVADAPEQVAAIGIEHATVQCRELLAAGAPGIHFYTLNKSPATRAIYERLGL
jgi:methylenetetrahydrofolate reductase (NADPH)